MRREGRWAVKRMNLNEDVRRFQSFRHGTMGTCRPGGACIQVNGSGDSTEGIASCIDDMKGREPLEMDDPEILPP